MVVDALLAADKDGPSAAVAVIDRHAGQFPQATRFLDGWRARFTGGSEDDVVFAALRMPDKADRFANLSENIKTGTHRDDTVLAAAEVMAGNAAWAEVRAIQARLTEVGTPRSVVLAAHAAFNTAAPAETLRILDAFKVCFRHGELPPSLIDLKERVHDALGDKSSAIAGYEQVVARTNDPRARRRLVQTYLGIGNLGSARHHAEQFVFGKLAHPTDAVALADIWRVTDPEFSRRLVVHAASDPRLPVQAAPRAFTLSIELGLKEVEARLAPIVFDVETHGRQTGVIAIDSVEALIAHMNARAEGIRHKFSAWLSGQQWGHATWPSDVRTFALLAAQWPDVEVGSGIFENHTEPHQGLSMLVEMVLAFAHYRSEPLIEKVRWIGSATELVVEAWPNSARGAITFLDRSIERLRIKEAAPLWPVFNRLRARR